MPHIFHGRSDPCCPDSAGWDLHGGASRWRPLRVDDSYCTAHSAHQVWMPFSFRYKPKEQQEGLSPAKSLTRQPAWKEDFCKNAENICANIPFPRPSAEQALNSCSVLVLPLLLWKEQTLSQKFTQHQNLPFLPGLGTLKQAFHSLCESRSDLECSRAHFFPSDSWFRGTCEVSQRQLSRCQILLPSSLLRQSVAISVTDFGRFGQIGEGNVGKINDPMLLEWKAVVNT